MEKVWRRVGLHSSRKKRDGSTPRSRPIDSVSILPPSVVTASQEVEYQNIQSIRAAELVNQTEGTLRSSYIIRNGDNLILVERRRRRRRRSGQRASSSSRHVVPIIEERSRTEKRRPPARLKLFGIKWPLHSGDRNSVSLARRFCRGRRSKEDNELYRSNSFKFERFDRERPDPNQAALCADYSLPVDCVGTAPRPRSFHEISAPKVEFVEAYCTPRDNTRRGGSPKRRTENRQSRDDFDTPHCSYYNTRRRENFDSERRAFDSYRKNDYSSTKQNRHFGTGNRDYERSPRCDDLGSARRTDFDLTRPGISSKVSPESITSAGSPPEPAPSLNDYRHRILPHHQYRSESSSSDLSSSSGEDEEEFGAYDASGAVPSLHSPDTYLSAPRRNPSPYYYGDLFKTAPSPAPTVPRRYRKSASLDAPHVAQRPTLPKRFSVAEEGLNRELEDPSSSSSEEDPWMPPRRSARDASGCVCAAPDDEQAGHLSRSVFYVPIPAPKWSGIAPAEMSHQLYETAFDSKITRSSDDFEDFDHDSNHPAFLQSGGRSMVSSASSAFEVVETSRKSRRKLAMKTDSVRRSKIPTISQKKESEAAALTQNMEKMQIKEEDNRVSPVNQFPVRGFTPSPPSTAPLPTKFPQSKEYSVINSIKSAPDLPAQPAHPRLKDLKLPVKSLKGREATTSHETSFDIKVENEDLKEKDNKEENKKNTENIFLEIKGRPTFDSETSEVNRLRGSKVAGPLFEFKKRPGIRRPGQTYSSTESMVTSSSGGSMESLKSSTSESNRSTTSTESRHSTTLSSHSSDSGGCLSFSKLHHHKILSSFASHHPIKHILSPISDISSQEHGSETSDNNKNNNSQKVSPDLLENTIISEVQHLSISKPKRRPPQNRLLSLAFSKSTGDAEIQGSDSGISIHSREGVDSRNAFVSFNKIDNKSDDDDGMTNINQDISELPFDMPKLRRRRALQAVKQTERNTYRDLSNLPFDIPKLNRKVRGLSLQLESDGGVSQTCSSQSVQDIGQGNCRSKLSLNFNAMSHNKESKARGLNLNLFGTGCNAQKEIVDAAIPLDRQGWYHGSITRIEAENVLRDASEGTFLVRNSESTKLDYSLSLKSVCGFMHLRIKRNKLNGEFSLGSGTDVVSFSTVPALLCHYSSRRLPIRGAEHMSLSEPLQAVLL